MLDNGHSRSILVSGDTINLLHRKRAKHCSSYLPRRGRECCSSQEASSVADSICMVVGRWVKTVQENENPKDDDDEGRQILVFGNEKGSRPRADLVRDLVHKVRATGGLGELLVKC